MTTLDQFASEHDALSRRYFLQLGAGGLAAFASAQAWAQGAPSQAASDPQLREAISRLEYLTPLAEFKLGGRGKPPIYEIPAERLPTIGLTRETWKLEVLPDPESNADIGAPLSKEKGNALDFKGLMKLAETHAVRFLHVLTCTNVPQPFGMGLWEGVPLRHVIWMTQPKRNVRRIFYHGYHNDDPAQIFRSSLPISRVLEEAPGELPVILCYKMNGQWLSQKGGGPVRMVAPGAYGNKSIKWLQRIYLTNNHQANDTYAEANNDVESPLKSFARFIQTPPKVDAGKPFPITGFAQVGASGLSKVQYWLRAAGSPLPADDLYLERGEWRDAAILPPPEHWGSDLPGGKLPPTLQVDPQSGRPYAWPIPNTIAHWAALVPPPPAGHYELRCRTVDANGIAQPLPRPFGRSGVNTIAMAKLEVTA